LFDEYHQWSWIISISEQIKNNILLYYFGCKWKCWWQINLYIFKKQILYWIRRGCVIIGYNYFSLWSERSLECHWSIDRTTSKNTHLIIWIKFFDFCEPDGLHWLWIMILEDFIISFKFVNDTEKWKLLRECNLRLSFENWNKISKQLTDLDKIHK
jgi:hypothetical protein